MASSLQFYLNLAKERIDEMDAVLASLEVNASQVTAESRAKADGLIADLRTKRAAFQENMKKQMEAGEAASDPCLRLPSRSPRDVAIAQSPGSTDPTEIGAASFCS